jgi:ubiquinone biosynthesis protein
MEYMEGAGVQDGAVLDEWGLTGAVWPKGCASVCSQILRDGFFHADPHPGNLRILRDGTIVFLDTGMVGRLGETRQRAVTRFFIGVTSKNSRMVVRAILDMDGASRHTGLKAFQKDMDRLIDKYLTRPINEIRIDELLFETFHTAFAHHVRIPREFAMLAKTLGTLQGTLETLDQSSTRSPSRTYRPKAAAARRSFQTHGPENQNGPARLRRAFLAPARRGARHAGQTGKRRLGLRLEFKTATGFGKGFQAALDRITVCLVLLAVSMILSGVIYRLRGGGKRGAASCRPSTCLS